MAIVISLIGRGQIDAKMHRLPSPMDRVQAIKDYQYEAFEEEERYKKQLAVELAESEEEDGDEEEEDDGDEDD